MSQPAILYIHTWEFDSTQPRINSLKQGHYYRLSTTEETFKKMLKDFEFTSVRACLKHEDEEAKSICH